MYTMVGIYRYQITKILELLRPFTLLAPLIVSSCVMIGSYYYNTSTSFTLNLYLIMVFPASICFAFLNAASNSLNQATDYREDAISKPYRPIPQGSINPGQAKKIAAFLYIISLILSFTINLIFFSLIALITLFSITYSLFPRMKQFLFFNQIWVAVPRGFLAVLASWSVFGDPFHQIPLAFGTIAAVFLIGGTSTKDILDAGADRLAGTHTLVNTLGLTKTIYISTFFMITAFALIIPCVYLKILDTHFIFLSLLILCSIAIALQMKHTYRNRFYENTTAWTLMYSTYFLFAVGFALLSFTFS